jgi:hypothetical protein
MCRWDSVRFKLKLWKVTLKAVQRSCEGPRSVDDRIRRCRGRRRKEAQEAASRVRWGLVDPGKPEPLKPTLISRSESQHSRQGDDAYIELVPAFPYALPLVMHHDI